MEFGPPTWQAEADNVSSLSALPVTEVGQILLTMTKFCQNTVLIFALDRCAVIALSLGGGGYEELLEIVQFFKALKEIKLLVVVHYIAPEKCAAL